MKLLFDTNVILDVLLDRQLFVEDALELFSAIEAGELQAVIGATTVTTIFYLVSKVLGSGAAKTAIHNLLCFFEVASVNRIVLEDALLLGFADFEDEQDSFYNCFE